MNGQVQRYPFDSTKNKQARGQPARRVPGRFLPNTGRILRFSSGSVIFV